LAATPIGVGHPGFVAFAAVAPMIPMTVPTFSAVTSRQLAGSTNGFRGGVGSGLSTFRARMSPSASCRHATGSAVGSSGPRMDGARGAKKTDDLRPPWPCSSTRPIPMPRPYRETCMLMQVNTRSSFLTTRTSFQTVCTGMTWIKSGRSWQSPARRSAKRSSALVVERTAPLSDHRRQ
jgi:hypothetical protein